MKFKLTDIVKASNAQFDGDAQLECAGISIDSRTIKPGELFVAIAGPHFDGHDHCAAALDSGALAVMIDKPVKLEGAPVLSVDATVDALGDLASWWRSQFDIPCVAITGSNGKSTTKEMTASALQELGPVLKTSGNFNNLIGLPLSIFKWNKTHSAAVLEMGMNEAGEIERLTKIAQPTVGMITNVTAAHLEKLSTVEAVAKAKGELFATMNPAGTIIVNDEDPLVCEIATGFSGRAIHFGMQNSSDVRFLHVQMHGLDEMELSVSVFGKELQLRLQLPGTHNVMNALAALSAAIALDVDVEKAAQGLAGFTPMPMRFEQVQLANGARLVNDSYNANPHSMLEAFRTVSSAKRAGRFVAVLGDMLELGEQAKKLHYELGEQAVQMGVNQIYVVGDFAKDIINGARSAGFKNGNAQHFASLEELQEVACHEIKSGDVFLIKGSRSMQMERVAEYLKLRIGTG